MVGQAGSQENKHTEATTRKTRIRFGLLILKIRLPSVSSVCSVTKKIG